MFESFRVVSSDEYLSRRSVFAALGWSVVGATVASVMLGYRPTSALAQVPASDTRLSALKGAGTATISDPGGALTKGLAVALYEPFRKYTGIDVKQLAREHEPIAAIKSMVEAKKVWPVARLAISWMSWMRFSRTAISRIHSRRCSWMAAAQPTV